MIILLWSGCAVGVKVLWNAHIVDKLALCGDPVVVGICNLLVIALC